MKKQIKWFGHICRQPYRNLCKLLTFNVEPNKRRGQPLNSLKRLMNKTFVEFGQSKMYEMFRKRKENDLIDYLGLQIDEFFNFKQ